IQAESAVLLGQGPAEETHLGGFGDDRLREGVVVFDLCLERDDFRADEFADGGKDVVEFSGVHGSSPSGRWSSADPRFRAAADLRHSSAPGRSSWFVLEQSCGSLHISPMWVSIESYYSFVVMNIRARRARTSLLTAVRSTPRGGRAEPRPSSRPGRYRGGSATRSRPLPQSELHRSRRFSLDAHGQGGRRSWREAVAVLRRTAAPSSTAPSPPQARPL